MDAVGMSLERREIQHLAAEPGNVISSHLCTDGNPVTGTETQGMFLELFIHSIGLMTVVLPAMVLQYGYCSWIDKVCYGLYGLFMVPSQRFG